MIWVPWQATFTSERVPRAVTPEDRSDFKSFSKPMTMYGFECCSEVATSKEKRNPVTDTLFGFCCDFWRFREFLLERIVSRIPLVLDQVIPGQA
jgi:hypothetical protein